MTPRRLVVTGAARGLGRALAERAREAGWAVLGSVRGDADRPPLEALGCATARLDLAEPASVDAFAREALDWAGGRVDALANNAGTAFPGPLEELDPADLRMQFEVNVVGQMALTRALLPGLRAARGRILFVGSDRAHVAVPLYGAYVASKRALEGLAEVLAMELRPAGVAVTVLEAGAFASAIRGPIARRLARHGRPGSPYAESVAAALASLGGPPIEPVAAMAAAALDLIERPDPPLVAIHPRTSRVRVARERLKALERDLGGLLDDG